MGPLFTEAAAKLLPDELSLETFNSHYLQRHSSGASSILAAAKVSHLLGSSQEEVDNLLFGTFGEAVVDLNVQSAQQILSFLTVTHSPRQEEYRERCEKRFERSTVFKRKDELERLKKEALSAGLLDDVEKENVLED